jgi:isopenicillin-N N-acyltransferase like protein
MRIGWIRVAVVFMGVICGWAWGGQLQELPEFKEVKRVGQSALYQGGGKRVLLLQGTPYQVGYAYGQLMGAEVREVVGSMYFLTTLADLSQKKIGMSTLEEAYRGSLPYVPARYREELKGLADGAGVDFHRLEVCNLIPEMMHCSLMSVMGKATKDGKLIHARVLDYPAQTKLQKNSIVIVIREPGCHAIMLGSYTGCIGCITGMNDRGISTGMMGWSEFGHYNGVPIGYALRMALEEYDSLPPIREFFARSRMTCRFATIFGDGKVPNALGIESRWDTGCSFFNPGQPHDVFSTQFPDSILISKYSHYENLVARVKQSYGKIDVPTAVEIIKCPVARPDNTHDAVMVPADGIMYLADAAVDDKKPEYQACYQTYYKHDIKRYLGVMDTLAKNSPVVPDQASVPFPNYGIPVPYLIAGGLVVVVVLLIVRRRRKKKAALATGSEERK